MIECERKTAKNKDRNPPTGCTTYEIPAILQPSNHQHHPRHLLFNFRPHSVNLINNKTNLPCRLIITNGGRFLGTISYFFFALF